MSETGPQLFLFSHELERVRARRGAGVAIVVDRHAGTPEIVHLHLAEPPPACGRDTLPLVWSFGAPEEGGDQADDATGVRLWIDDSTMPVRARARLRTAAPQRAEHEAEVEIIRTGHAAFTRNAPVLETDALARRSVLCIGLGSGGSAVADQLARSGVGRFVLWDHDRLESHNIGRHICTLRDIGRRKVLAVRDHILAVNPAAQVETVHTDVLYASDRLAEIMETVDGVIAGTDNNASRFAINDAALRASRPAWYGRAYLRACGGDVIQVLPGRGTPCYACHAEDRIVHEEISSSRDADRIAYADRPVPVEPGLAVDIQPIANMIARLALLRLCADTASPLADTAEELDAPFYLWANQRREVFVNWKPMQRSYSRMAILRWYAITVPRNPECLTCAMYDHPCEPAEQEKAP